LSRAITELVSRPDVELVVLHPGGGPWFDPGRNAYRVATAIDLGGTITAADIAWRDTWREAGTTAWQAETAPAPLPAASGRDLGVAVVPDAANSTRDASTAGMPLPAANGRDLGAAMEPDTANSTRHASAAGVSSPPTPTSPGVGLTGAGAAAVVASSCGDQGVGLVVAASGAIRYLDLVPAPRSPLAVFASRGAAGIDGTVSTASGIAYGTGGPVRLLIGDLAFLHDAGALAIGELETPPDLDIVVLNDHGGGIFCDLEHAAAPGELFRRYFLTPQRVDLAQLARAYGADYERADSAEVLAHALTRPPSGIRVIEVPLPEKRTVSAQSSPCP
jgi:2-succinyl-5-enolpyruvyl-6-hydroxy-3-cyclohexene-1-carboxylate synthase